MVFPLSWCRRCWEMVSSIPTTIPCKGATEAPSPVDFEIRSPQFLLLPAPLKLSSTISNPQHLSTSATPLPQYVQHHPHSQFNALNHSETTLHVSPSQFQASTHNYFSFKRLSRPLQGLALVQKLLFLTVLQTAEQTQFARRIFRTLLFLAFLYTRLP